MGQPGAKKLDQIVSVTPGDVHITIPPTGTPVPVPHPCTSIIKDKVAEKVKVMGQPGAVKGSISKHSPPHFPLPPGSTFSKTPANKGEIFTASSNVFYEGKEAAMRGDTAKMCADPVDAPVGKVIGTAETVLVGGGGSGSGSEGSGDGNANKAGGAAGAGLGVVTGTGHPVDVATGNLIISGEDFELDGPLPIQFVRTYLSTTAANKGPLGYGWVHNFQESIQLVFEGDSDWKRIHDELTQAGNPAPDRNYVVYRDPNGLASSYRLPPEGEKLADRFHRRQLSRVGSLFSVTNRYGIISRFGRIPGQGNNLQLIEVIDRNGNKNVFRYTHEGLLTEVEDCYSRTLIIIYENQRVTEIRLRLPQQELARRWCSYKYDQAGDLIEVVDRGGFSTRFGYADHLIVEDQNRDGYSFYFEYDSNRRCIKTWGQDGYLTRYLSYDLEKGRTREINGEGEQTVYSHTPTGVVARIDKGGSLFSESKFDAHGRVIERASGAGEMAKMVYGEAGELLATIDGEGSETTYTHNEFGQVTSVKNPLGEVTTYEYDARGNMTARTLQSGVATRWAHDSRGRVVEETRVDGSRIAIAYDEFGHPKHTTGGGRWVTWSYDALGNLLRYVAGNGLPRVYEWNDQGYPVRIFVGEELTALFEYSREGYVLSDRDGYGTVRKFVYGPPGVAVETSTYSGSGDQAILRARLKITRDLEGRPIRVVDSKGLVRAHAYDAAGRLIHESEPDGTIRELTLDGAGKPVEIRDNRGTIQKTAYNGRGDALSIDYTDGSRDAFEYDDAARVISAGNAWGAVEFEYDAEGRQIVRRYGDFEIRADIAPDRRRVAWSWSEGPTAAFHADADGILETIAFGGRRIAFAFDASRLPAQRRLPNGLEESYAYDALGRQTRYELRSAREVLIRRQIEYDGYRIARITDSSNGERDFCYDVHGRLERVTGASNEEYRYDARDNLIGSHHFRESQVEGADLLRRAGERQLEYDERARVIAVLRENGHSLRFAYDAKGDLTHVAMPDGGTVEYRYDVFGRRVEKRFRGGARDGTAVRFFWNHNDLVKEEWWHGEELREERCYLFAAHVPIARLDRRAGIESAIFYHTDHSGTPRLCTDERGEVVWRADADAFGYDASASAFQPLRLPGQYFDEETGLHYNRYRYYDPFTARYLQPDPIHTIADPNRYNYPLDPLLRVDPLGLSSTRVINADPGDDWMNIATARDVRVQAGVPLSDMYGDAGAPDLTGVDHVVIHAHGNPYEIGYSTPDDRLKGKVGEFSPGMNGKQLAEYLKAQGFTGSRVTIVSCETGKTRPGGGSFAQDVADELGGSTQVKSWNGKVTVKPNGDVCVLSHKNAAGNYTQAWPPGVGMAVFTAGGPAGGRPGDFSP